jgi:hypothetical protein
VRIYVAAVEALMEKERQGETQETIKIPEFHSPLNANVLFCRNLTLCMTKLGVLTLSFPHFTDISNV